MSYLYSFPETEIVNVYETNWYTYKEGFETILSILNIAVIAAFISMIVSIIIGLKGKDRWAVCVTNIMIKTIAICFYQMVKDFFYTNNNFEYKYILFLIAIILAEGSIYMITLKHNKNNPMMISTICNVWLAIISLLMFIIYQDNFIELWKI